MRSGADSEALDLERAIPTTEEDSAALRRLRRHPPLSTEAFLRALARIPPPSREALHARRAARGDEPFRL